MLCARYDLSENSIGEGGLKLDKDKLIKWIKEEIESCQYRRETERENAMRELLLKIERGYFDNSIK